MVAWGVNHAQCMQLPLLRERLRGSLPHRLGAPVRRPVPPGGPGPTVSLRYSFRGYGGRCEGAGIAGTPPDRGCLAETEAQSIDLELNPQGEVHAMATAQKTVDHTAIRKWVEE